MALGGADGADSERQMLLLRAARLLRGYLTTTRDGLFTSRCDAEVSLGASLAADNNNTHGPHADDLRQIWTDADALIRRFAELQARIDATVQHLEQQQQDVEDTERTATTTTTTTMRKRA